MSYLLALCGVGLAALARVAVARPRRHHPLWVTAMAGAELAGPFLLLALALVAGFGIAGWSGGFAGTAGSVLLILAAIGFAVALRRGFAAGRPGRMALTRFTGADEALRWSRLGAVLAPVSRPPRGVTAQVGLVYGPHPRHLVDRIGPATGRRPALIHVHGGGWWRGRRGTQARPLVHAMAAAGWQVFTPSYRLSPEVAAPEHLVDLKRVIAWIRAHADDLGVDPGFIAVAGGSTGGNLAALAALTGGDATLQPGFEDADTAVQVCLALYGVHDLLDEAGLPLWPYLATAVVGCDPVTDPGPWRRVSPIARATANRPPFLVVHGAADTLVPSGLSRRLVAALEAAGGPAVGWFEVPWGNHGFDFFAGPRGRITAAVSRRALEHVHHSYLERTV